MKSGLVEGLPYSLSRWTDVPGDEGKWAWFKTQVKQGSMIAIDPRSAIPSYWSLHPEDTLGLVFWTKNPENLVFDAPWLKNYRFKAHLTVTGWTEVERGAGSLRQQLDRLYAAATTFGPDRVTWRFSPVPMVSDVVRRFEEIATTASRAGLDRVYLSFLQENDLMPETRSPEDRANLLVQMAEVGAGRGIRVLLCNEDRTLQSNLHPNLASGICAPPEDFSLPDRQVSPSEGCGCVLMVDPFTLNESCSIGCEYCYAADKHFAPKKQNTTRTLPIIR